MNVIGAFCWEIIFHRLLLVWFLLKIIWNLKKNKDLPQMVTEFMDMAIAEWNNLAKKMPKVLNSSMSSTVIMNEEAERILSKPVIKKKHLLLPICC